MIRIRFYILFTLLLSGTILMAQNSTCSPYSNYGLGELSDHAPNAYRAMGGVGIGMRSNKSINPMQPASYTACDSLTFMFDLAAGVSWSRYEDASGRRNRANGNLEYISLQFPLWKQHIAFSAGVLPFSSKGYDIVLSDSVRTNYHYKKVYGGYGTISSVYGGLSFNLWDWVALGANAYYMFGSLYNSRDLSFSENLTQVTEQEYMRVSSFRWRVGAQLFHTFGDHAFALGGIFEYKMPLKSEYYIIETISEWYADSTIYDAFDTPTMYGVGVSYCWQNRLTLAFDYSRQLWSSCRYGNINNYYRNRNHYSLGATYRHNPLGREYVDRVEWRLGAQMGNSYLTQVPGLEYTLSMGIGLPLRNVGTTINTTIEYTHRGVNNALREDNVKLTINAAISENWFFKRKL